MLSESDQETFTRLWTEAQPPVSRYLLSLVSDPNVAKDLLQNTALVLLRKFSEYDQARPFLPWALGVAKYQLLGHHRDEARNRLTFDSELLDHYTEKWGELAEQDSEQVSTLHQCIRELPQRQRELVHLRYFDELNSREIARHLKQTSDHVRVTLQRTRDKLRKCVEQKHRLAGGPS